MAVLAPFSLAELSFFSVVCRWAGEMSFLSPLPTLWLVVFLVPPYRVELLIEATRVAHIAPIGIFPPQ